jgi:hypothetical protein
MEHRALQLILPFEPALPDRPLTLTPRVWPNPDPGAGGEQCSACGANTVDRHPTKFDILVRPQAPPQALGVTRNPTASPIGKQGRSS